MNELVHRSNNNNDEQIVKDQIINYIILIGICLWTGNVLPAELDESVGMTFIVSNQIQKFLVMDF